jgi:hypothetical protein
MLDTFEAHVLNELFRLTQAVQRAAQEIELKDAQIADLTRQLEDARGATPTNHGE